MSKADRYTPAQAAYKAEYSKARSSLLASEQHLGECLSIGLITEAQATDRAGDVIRALISKSSPAVARVLAGTMLESFDPRLSLSGNIKFRLRWLSNRIIDVPLHLTETVARADHRAWLLSQIERNSIVGCRILY